jgi:Na+/proline symporter
LLFSWREKSVLTKHLPFRKRSQTAYSKRAGRISALPIFILVSPAPYILMLGLLFQFLTGGNAPFLFYASLVALFSVLYITIGGFGAVIRTDILQVILMFGGFIILLIYAVMEFGGFGTLLGSAHPATSILPAATHGSTSWSGFLLHCGPLWIPVSISVRPRQKLPQQHGKEFSIPSASGCFSIFSPVLPASTLCHFG